VRCLHGDEDDFGVVDDLAQRSETERALLQQRFDRGFTVRSALAVRESHLLHLRLVDVIAHDVVAAQRHGERHRHPQLAQADQSYAPRALVSARRDARFRETLWCSHRPHSASSA
jgi:hypothetical protein